MNRSSDTESELSRIRSCLHIAVEQTGVVLTTGECMRLAAAFQEAMADDHLVFWFQSTIDRAAAEMEPKA